MRTYVCVRERDCVSYTPSYTPKNGKNALEILFPPVVSSLHPSPALSLPLFRPPLSPLLPFLPPSLDPSLPALLPLSPFLSHTHLNIMTLKDGLEKAVPSVYVYMCVFELYVYMCVFELRDSSHHSSHDSSRGGGLGSRPKKMYGERLGDGVEYHLMSPTPRR